jgi:hypothetical protein
VLDLEVLGILEKTFYEVVSQTRLERPVFVER